MIPLACDGCGKTLLLDEDVRYVVRIEVFAAYDPLELTAEDLRKDHRREMEELVRRMARMDPKEVEDGVYRRMEFHLCPACQKAYLKNPLGRAASGGAHQ